MTRRLLILAALGGGLAGGTAAGATSSPAPTAATRPAVVVEASCSVPGAARAALSAARAAAPARAPVTLVCGPDDARIAVLRAVARGHDEVLGAGPAVRAAQGELAAAHPEVTMGALRSSR